MDSTVLPPVEAARRTTSSLSEGYLIVMPESFLSTIARKVTTLNQLKQLHLQLIQHALHEQSLWVARLISLCTLQHAPPSYTRFIFRSARFPDAGVFTCMLRYYSKMDGGGDEILLIFEEMQKCRLFPDPCVYPALVKAGGKNGVLFHSLLIKIGNDLGKYTRNALINVYGKYGPVESARQLFDEMTERSIPDWNALISGYWHWGAQVEARKLFDIMPFKNVISWTTMVTGYSKMKDLESARSYFDQMPEKSIVSWNAMISGYAQSGLSQEALSMFHEMVSLGFRPNETTWVALISSCSSCGDPRVAESVVKLITEMGICLNPFVKNVLLDFYAKFGHLEVAQKIFDEMTFSRNVVTWNSMISAHLRVGDLTAARELFANMPEKDIVSWNSMIAGYAQNGQTTLAIEIFKEMVDGHIIPDEVTMVSVISACGHLGALELGNWVVNCFSAYDIKLSLSGYNSLIFMYSRCGSMNEAKKIFSEMETRDVVSCNALMTGFASHGNVIQALELIQKMKDEGIDPDHVTYVCALTACSHSGMLEHGKRIFESMEAPNMDHYACMVDLLGRVGKLDEAKTMIQEMPFEPHAGIYGSLLSASRIHRRLDLGELAALKLFELEPKNSGNFILLSNMYASAGKWKDVDRIRILMKTRGVMKKTGWSWVEHDRKIHKFIVGDRSHEQSVEIYNILAELKKKMQDAGYIADKSNVLRDVEDEEKEEIVGVHSEKLAVAFCLLVTKPGTVLRVVKNLRICFDCHTAMTVISKLVNREIIVRDNNRFHHFKDNICSCNDYW